MDSTTHSGTTSGTRKFLFFLLIVGIVFLSRYLTRGGVYFIDGPAFVRAIQNHTYVIQSPGYWLFARTAGLFHDPAFGLIFLNQIFSALGAGVFFLLCLELELSCPLALLAAFTYASIFFAWFAGDVHSAYATQLLFPALAAWLLVRYRKEKALWLLLAGTASLAIGTGMRPSDGVFLLPLYALFLMRSVDGWRRRWIAVAVFAALCLSWYYPTKVASHLATQTVSGELGPIAATSSILLGASVSHALANAARLFVPLLVAFWMLIPAWFSPRPRSTTTPLLLWFVPGFLFYLLVFIANATYIVFALPALILLAALINKRKLAMATLSICLVWNCLFYLAARPIRKNNVVVLPLDYYAIMYTEYAVRHQWNTKIANGLRIP